jgi:NADPH:quinone reductase-like Zn-dependent oxidoreductase
MKAVLFDAPGDPRKVLRNADVEVPEIGADEVLVRVVARPIHPADWMFIRGQYRMQPRLPQIAGLEGAGIIAAAGEATRMRRSSIPIRLGPASESTFGWRPPTNTESTRCTMN